jgi:hypothetical protein
MIARFFVGAGALALMVGASASAHAQFRPGSSPDGGRIRAICNDDRFTTPERKICEEDMRAAKTSKERAEVKAAIQERLKERQKAYDESIRKNQNAIEQSNTR